MINKTKVKTEPVSHQNFMGGTSYDVSNPLLKLKLAASSCFFGEPKYYTEKLKDKAKSKYAVAIPKIQNLNNQAISYLRSTLEAIDPIEWRSQSSQEMMESAIDQALNFDPEKTLELATELRSEDHIRVTPQVILVRAAHHPK